MRGNDICQCNTTRVCIMPNQPSKQRVDHVLLDARAKPEMLYLSMPIYVENKTVVFRSRGQYTLYYAISIRYCPHTIICVYISAYHRLLAYGVKTVDVYAKSHFCWSV